MFRLNNFIFILTVFLVSFLFVSSEYTVPNRYFISCGSDKDFEFHDSRRFVGDQRPGQSSISPGKSSVVRDPNPSSGTPDIYQTARVYRTSSSYKFEVEAAGTYMLRLHFFFFVAITSSSSLDYSLFNVSAADFLLLPNYKVQNTSRRPLVEEFLIPSKAGKFAIHFTPHESSLAFVNAIEFFLAPDSFLPENPLPRISPAVANTGYHGLLYQALHLIHRINVGGTRIKREDDTLWREWIPDDEFLVNREAARNVTSYSRIRYRSPGANVYIAPDPVYQTAKVPNMELGNVTWDFGVTNYSTNFLRAHFCDIVGQAPGEVKFNFYVYRTYKTQVSAQDVLLASPFYFDFEVDTDGSGSVNISIRTVTDSFKRTAYLNGLEIMEIINKSYPVSKKKHLVVILGSAGGAALFAFTFTLGCWFFSKRRKAGPSKTSDMRENEMESSISAEKSPILSILSRSNLGLKIPLSEVQRATGNFDLKRLIGEGGFGKVYRGTLQGVEVAVKRGVRNQGQGFLEFRAEIEVLSEIHYRHLVSLIGFCDEKLEMILVYEFMENGTLREHLYSEGATSERSAERLSWKQRLEICIGAAKGLNFLHTASTGVIIHRDVKSTNILLDHDFVAKVADFGLSKLRLPDPENVTMGIKGSFGYLDPEYFTSLQLTEKSDVYSFGVVLLEVLCARPAIIDSDQKEEINLAEWGMLWKKKGQLEKVIDPALVGQIIPSSLRIFSETIEKCLQANGADRPCMREVLWDLEYALQLQESAVHKGQYEDSIVDSSLGATVQNVQDFPSDSFPADEDDYQILIADIDQSLTQSDQL